MYFFSKRLKVYYTCSWFNQAGINVIHFLCNNDLNEVQGHMIWDKYKMAESTLLKYSY